mgnify:CR=1 FL=1
MTWKHEFSERNKLIVAAIQRLRKASDSGPASQRLTGFWGIPEEALETSEGPRRIFWRQEVNSLKREVMDCLVSGFPVRRMTYDPKERMAYDPKEVQTLCEYVVRLTELNDTLGAPLSQLESAL